MTVEKHHLLLPEVSAAHMQNILGTLRHMLISKGTSCPDIRQWRSTGMASFTP
jgi:hypothetical protein